MNRVKNKFRLIIQHLLLCYNNYVMARTKSGSYRKKRSDTQMKTIEKKYGKDLGVRSDMKLGTYLKKKGYTSLNKLLKNGKKR